MLSVKDRTVLTQGAKRRSWRTPHKEDLTVEVVLTFPPMPTPREKTITFRHIQNQRYQRTLKSISSTQTVRSLPHRNNLSKEKPFQRNRRTNAKLTFTRAPISGISIGTLAVSITTTFTFTCWRRDQGRRVTIGGPSVRITTLRERMV